MKNIWQNEQLVNWLSAIGTLGAVWVSLWLVLREDKRRGKLEVNGIKVPVSVMHPTRNYVEPIPVISCVVFNYSKFPITISTIKVNVYKRKWIKNKFISGGILLTDQDLGKFSKLPMVISSFETDTWLYSKYLFNNYIKTQIIPKIDKDKEKQILIEFQASDSFGKSYKKKIRIKKSEIKEYLMD